MNRVANGIYYAMWLPVVGLSLIGVRFTAPRTRKKKLLGFLLLGLIMAALFLLPACGGSSSRGGGGGCTGCTPSGNYTVTVTGTDSVDTNLTHCGRSRAHRQLTSTHYCKTFIKAMWGQPPSAVLGPKADVV